MNRSLVLTGFSGTGKSTVGSLIAARLHREWVDMDRVIETGEGMSINEIFSTRGEEYFRAREREVCSNLASREGLVISTGGGALLNEHNRTNFGQAFVVCLDASIDTVLQRLQRAADRPLLAGNREVEARRLYASRRPAYAKIPIHVNTDGLTVAQVAERIIAEFERAERMIELQVANPMGISSIRIADGLLSRIGECLADERRTVRCVVVSNSTVSRLYGHQVLSSLSKFGFDPDLIEIGDGEKFKTLETVSRLYDEFANAGMERNSVVIALGGGVVGDVAGFASATFMRGLPFVQVPTTLLAMVDASIGGKVGVDHPSGKNLVGAFKFPRAILIDPLVLQTLPADDYRSGLAEVFKHAIIGDAGLFKSAASQFISGDMIARAMGVKIALIEQDPFEENVRAHLNLGHTFGHALENLSGYSIRHGEAVAIGIATASRLAARMGLCSSETETSILSQMREFHLPSRVPAGMTAGDIRRVMQRDKKVRNKSLRLVLPRSIGQVDIFDRIPDSEIEAALFESGAARV